MRILMILNIVIPVIALISSFARASDIGGAQLRNQLTADFSQAAIQYLALDPSQVKLTLISGEYDSKACDHGTCKLHSQVRFLATVAFRDNADIHGQMNFSAKTFLIDVDKDLDLNAPTTTNGKVTIPTPPTFSAQIVPNSVALGKKATGAAAISDSGAIELRDRMVREFSEATTQFVVQQSMIKGTGLRHIIAFHDNMDDDPDSSGTINVPLLNSDVKLTLIDGDGNAADCEQHELCRPQSQARFLVTVASRSMDKDADSFSVVALMINVRRDASVSPNVYNFDLIPEEIHLENN